MQPDHALTAIFQIFLPILLLFLSLTFARMYPLSVIQHVYGSAGFDGLPRSVVMTTNPMAAPGGPGGAAVPGMV